MTRTMAWLVDSNPRLWGKGFYAPQSTPRGADGRSLPVVLSHLGGSRLTSKTRRGVRRPENPEPPGARHVRGGDGVLRPRGDVLLSPEEVDVRLISLEVDG